MNMPPRILVAGIGNIFLGDDAFGVQVAQKLLQRPQRDDVRIVDFGIRGLDLAYALMDDIEAAIFIDAVPRGEAPGTLYVIEPQIPDAPDANSQPAIVEGHSMHPEQVLKLARAMGADIGHVLLVGCEPTPIDPENDMQMDLSPAVQKAIDPAIEIVDSLIEQLLSKPLTTEAHHASTNIQSPPA